MASDHQWIPRDTGGVAAPPELKRGNSCKREGWKEESLFFFYCFSFLCHLVAAHLKLLKNSFTYDCNSTSFSSSVPRRWIRVWSCSKLQCMQITQRLTCGWGHNVVSTGYDKHGNVCLRGRPHTFLMLVRVSLNPAAWSSSARKTSVFPKGDHCKGAHFYSMIMRHFIQD